MRIAMIGHKRIPGREGGVEVVVEEISTRLVQLGHDVTAYNRKDNTGTKIGMFKGIRIINIPTIKKKSLDAVVYSLFSSIHALFGHYDIIHYHALGPSVMLIIPHIFGIKTVVTVHGLNYKTPKWNGFGAKYIKFGEKIVAKYADEVIVLSQEIENYIMREYGRKTNYIPNGVTLSQIRKPQVIKYKYGLNKNEYILFLSRIVPGKGLEHLIEAYSRIDTNKKLVIAGGSSYANDFYNKISAMAEKDNRVIFTGFVHGEVLDELYSNAFLFVFPSEAEGMPMCLLEAMSYNCKCLVSDIPENVEVVKQYAKTFKVGDVESLKQSIEEMLLVNGNNEIETREYIRKKYNWDNMVNWTKELYKN